MISERLYRWLLVLYPREHRREYGELMVQMFRDRMSCDGNGFRGPIIWLQMITDLVGTSLSEHKEGFVMTKRIWIGATLGVFLLALASVVGMNTLLAQTNGAPVVKVYVLEDTETFTMSGTGSDGIGEALQGAVKEGYIDQAAADDIVQSAAGEGPAVVLQYEVGSGGVAEAVQQAVDEDKITQQLADTILRSISEQMGDVQHP